jgi:hypothetical protein
LSTKSKVERRKRNNAENEEIGTSAETTGTTVGEKTVLIADTGGWSKAPMYFDVMAALLGGRPNKHARAHTHQTISINKNTHIRRKPPWTLMS